MGKIKVRIPEHAAKSKFHPVHSVRMSTIDEEMLQDLIRLWGDNASAAIRRCIDRCHREIFNKQKLCEGEG